MHSLAGVAVMIAGGIILGSGVGLGVGLAVGIGMAGCALFSGYKARNAIRLKDAEKIIADESDSLVRNMNSIY